MNETEFIKFWNNLTEQQIKSCWNFWMACIAFKFHTERGLPLNLVEKYL